MPELIIIAGCNGAGKSTFAPSFLPDGISSFDYDKLFLKYYNELPDSEFREKFAKDKATKDFEQEVINSLSNKTDFCYETNFDAHPLYWSEKFKKRGFKVNLIFFCIENQEIVRHRIQVRAEFKGHFVDNMTIDLKWKAGYKNLNKYYSFFDNILFVDNSKPNEVYTNILQIENGLVELMSDGIPDYFSRRLPNIYNLIKF
jgi:predicted ABC-type ATPase